MIQWEDRDNGDVVLEIASGMQTELALELGPVSQSMDSGRYRCRVQLDSITILETVTLTIEGEPTNIPWPLQPHVFSCTVEERAGSQCTVFLYRTELIYLSGGGGYLECF